MGTTDESRGRTDAPHQDATGPRAERGGSGPEAAAGKASLPAGGIGGQSGNGQMQPHRGAGDPEGQGAVGEPIDPQAAGPVPDNGPTYQTGGVGLDREQQVEERKRRESGVGSTKGRGADGQGGGFDPPPGAPSR